MARSDRTALWACLVAICLGLPWVLYSVANQRGIDTFSALIPVLIVALCFGRPLDRRRGPDQAQQVL